MSKISNFIKYKTRLLFNPTGFKYGKLNTDLVKSNIIYIGSGTNIHLQRFYKLAQSLDSLEGIEYIIVDVNILTNPATIAKIYDTMANIKNNCHNIKIIIHHTIPNEFVTMMTYKDYYETILRTKAGLFIADYIILSGIRNKVATIKCLENFNMTINYLPKFCKFRLV